MKTFTSLTAALAAAFCLGPMGHASARDDALDIPALLKGKLIAFQDGKFVDAELTGDPEYYIVYHSASW